MLSAWGHENKLLNNTCNYNLSVSDDFCCPGNDGTWIPVSGKLSKGPISKWYIVEGQWPER
jgi:hypothetical protein